MGELNGFLIDVTFKPVANGKWNLWSWTSFHNDKNLVFARIYTNRWKKADHFARMFAKVWETVNKIREEAGMPCLSFAHIHGEGIGWIAADLDQGQAKGLGLFLNEIDPSREWYEHLAHFFIACLIHYERNVQQTGFSEAVKGWMKSIPFAESDAQVRTLMAKIKNELSVTSEDLDKFVDNEKE